MPTLLLVTPTLPTIQLAVGTYKEIALKLHKIDGNEESNNGASLVEESDNLFDNSIYLAGTYTGTFGGETVTNKSFVFSYDLTEHFYLTGDEDTSEGFTISATEINSIIVAFRLAKWFNFQNQETNSDELDFRNAELTNSQIQFNKNSQGNNSEIRNVIRDNIKESADYGKDRDGDGKLGKDEDDDPDSEDDGDD